MKMKEKSLVNHELVKNASCISPSNISQKKKTSISKFGKLVTMTYENNDLTVDEADKAKDQFESFIASEVKTFQEEFSKFDTLKDRLDAFYKQWLHRNEEYSSLWKVFVFTLSHGQAQIERAFNINSDFLVENMLPPSIIAQRRVYDHLNSLGVSSHDYQIENDLRIQCMNANSKYKEHCKEKKKAEEVSEKKEKLNGLLANIETIKRQKLELSKTITSLEKKVSKCFDKAEEHGNDPEKMRIEVAKGNGIRKVIGEKRKQDKLYDQEVENLTKEVDELKSKKKRSK